VTLSFEGARIDGGSPGHRSTLVQREIEIYSVPDLAWDLQVRVNDWPSWQPGISDSSISESMGSGTQFSWADGERTLHARVDIFRRRSALSWSAVDGGVTLIQRWTFTPTRRGVRVFASELRWDERSGDDATAQSRACELALDTWLANLKAEAEART
jgi:hypothetical protein